MINPLKLPLTLLCAKFVYPLLLLSPQILVRDPDSPLGYGSPLVALLSPYLGEAVAFLLVMGTLWLLAGRAHVPGVGDAGELAAVPGEPAGGAEAGRGRVRTGRR